MYLLFMFVCRWP